MNSQLKTPVALIIFKRPDLTEKVFEVIRQAKPTKLLVIADGSRSNYPGEAEKCAATRAIIDRVDWNCEVLKNYSEVNLGCAKRPETGINWVFEQVPEAIILEDDCLPAPSFFRYCEELLEKYREDQRIMLISGNNFQFGIRRSKYSYYFSRNFHTWGWATWRRAWQYYDFDLKKLPEILEDSWLEKLYPDPKVRQYWEQIFNYVYRQGKTHLWDYQWVFSCLIQGSFCILPNVNLISNIGFGTEATHANYKNSRANLPVEEMPFPMQHPEFIICDIEADNFTQKTRQQEKNDQKRRELMARIQRKIPQLFRWKK